MPETRNGLWAIAQLTARASIWIILASGCSERAEIRLVPLYPADEPDLLERAAVDRLEIRADPVDGDTAGESVSVIVERGDTLEIDDLSEGSWRISVEGFDAQGREVVYGETWPFEIAAGQQGEVEFFLGRSMAFNLAALDPPDVAAALDDLVDHTATAFADSEGHPWILVAGGRHGAGETPLGQALLVDPVAFEIEELPVLSCPRAGHAAFVVQTGAGPRVVLSGGESECGPSLEVYEPETRSFREIASDCAEPTGTRDAVPEVRVKGTTVTHTGRVIVPGCPRCAVDIETGESESMDGPAGPCPDSPSLVASNRDGQILILDGTAVYIDSAVEGEVCFDDAVWDPDAQWTGIEEHDGRRAVVLGNDSFLVVGGAGSETAETGWSIVSARSCVVDAVMDGPPGERVPVLGFAAIDLEMESGTAVLFAGGGDDPTSPSDSVWLLYQPAEAVAPTWHTLSSEDHDKPAALRKPRFGHAAAAAGNGTTWILGGGGSVEIFVRGRAGLDGPSHIPLRPRSPMLTSMTVMDTNQGMRPLNTTVAQTLPSAIYARAEEFVALFFLFSSADRGIGDGLIGAGVLDDKDCTAKDTGTPSDIGGVISGYVANTEFESSDAWATYSTETWGSQSSAKAQMTAETELGKLAALDRACSWRQLLRVGFDGLDMGPKEKQGEAEIRTEVGVNLLLLVTSGDDCSQGVFDESGPKPGPEILAQESCTSEGFDPYFRMPPATQDDLSDLTARIADLVWDPEDLIVALVGNPSTSSECGAGVFDDPGDDIPLFTFKPTRRLRDTLESALATGGTLVAVDPCDAQTSTGIEAGFQMLREFVANRNFRQACVPAGIIDEPAESAFVDGENRFLPIDRNAASSQIAAVESLCQVVYVRYEASGDPVHARAVPVPAGDGGWILGADTDGRAGCQYGWVVRVGPQNMAPTEDFGGAAIMCVR